MNVRRLFAGTSLFMRCLALLFYTIPQAGYGQEYDYSISWPYHSDDKQDIARDTHTIMNLLRQGTNAGKLFPDSALYYYQKAAQYSLDADYREGQALAWYNIGYTEITRAHNDTALFYFQKAFPYFKENKRLKQYLVATYGNIGIIYFFRGDYKLAVKYYDSSLREGIKAGLPDKERFLANTYGNLGIIYLRLNQYALALTYLNGAEAICRKNNFPELLANMLLNKIELYTQLGEYDKAITCYEQGIKIAQQHRLKAQEMTYLCSISAIKLRQNKPEEAIAYLKNTDFSISDANDYNFRITPGYILGKAYWQIKDYGKAEYYLTMAINLARKKNINDAQTDALKTLADIYEATGRYKQALKQQKQYQQMKDSLLSTEKAHDINELEIKYRIMQKDQELAVKDRDIIKAQAQSQHQIATIWITSLCILLLSSILIFFRYQQTAKLRRFRQQKELDLLKATMEGEEAERMRVGQELHDGVSGLLSTIKMNLVTLRLNRRDIAHERHFISTIELTDEAIDELRKTAHNLVPSNLIKNGVGKAIKGFCERVNASSPVHIQVHETGHPLRLDPARELVLYRILQELVHNMIKHASATKGLVSFSWQEQLLLVTVEDNGVGITQKQTEGIGLDNIRKRIAALNGTIEIDQKSGEGTSVYIECQI